MNIQIELFSEWQCGSGLASGSDVDLLAVKDPAGFPMIPGRTLKGLLAWGARELATLKSDDAHWQQFVKECFGQAADGNKPSDAGLLQVTNATLSLATRRAIPSPAFLFRKRSATAIDGNIGQAMAHTLRRMEVAIPMTLFATATGCPEPFMPCLRDSMAWVKQMGAQRHRGLGRCRISEVK
jgi:hypothetical protein